MKHQRPVYDSDERIFTLFDIQRLIRSQKKKIVKASWIGALIGFSCFLIIAPPKYRIHATFKEAANTNVNGTGSLEKLMGSFGGGSSESQIIAMIQSYPVLKPLVERMGAQIVVSKRGRLSAIYRRIRDNILAERKITLPDIDWFVFRNVVYSGERRISYSLRFEDPEHFSVLSGKKIIASGSFGTSVRLPEAQLTLVKVPKNLRLRFDYSFSILPWVDAVQSIRSNLKVAAVKNHKSIFDFYFTNRDRYFGTELLNALMEEYRNYLQRDHDELVKEQLAYLQKKQEEICGQMSSVFDDYTGYLQTNLTHSGQLNVKQEAEEISNEYKMLEHKVMAIDLELELLTQIESDPKAFGAIEANPSYQVPQQIAQSISDLKQQRDLIELSFPDIGHAFNEEKYESRKEELKGIRERLSGVQSLLKGADKGDALSQNALLEPERFLEAWAARLDNSQPEEREDLAGYLENHIRLLSMQEKIAQEQIFYGKEIPSEFRGIDLETARELFKEYNSKLDRSIEFLGHFTRLGEEINESDFEISSLSAVLSDPLSMRLIAQSSEIVLKLKDETHRSEKERDRWAEELSLQKKILKDHLDQLTKVEKLKSEMIQEKMAALQTISLGCISGEIAVLQERLSDWIKNQKMTLKAEHSILKEKMNEVRGGFSNLPEKWRREEWLNLRKEMGIKMVQGLTELVESKTISSHLHHVESKPLDFATVPFLPCHPGLLIKAFLGAFLAGFAVFSRSFFRTVLKGFPSSNENLRARRYPVLGVISSFCDGPASDPLGGADLEALRQISLFLDKSPKAKVVGIIEGKGPDYSYALAEHLARMSLRPLLIRCDFNVKFSPQDLPGLLQVWKKEISDPPIRRRQGYDYLTSGGHTPYGAEVIRSHHFQKLLERFKNDYDFVLLVFRAPLHSVESLAPLSLCDLAIVTVFGEPTEQLTPFVDWAYHEDMCRLAILTAGLPHDMQ